ncbi:hypothetical protein E2P81_ATG09886 [Venturia nashicola]|uniref:DUF572-domain-containing protein n=1 Tax=Venturia nashicola TaxID=86259 RepID=A0A4Z1NR56_9PEZI|nr:hypothetical protein E6O75_ATG10102 [Venturia nashicola]TLD15038.1 hypothetical protein E2P81_ATG09886 [Venturia nashicola]
MQGFNMGRYMPPASLDPSLSHDHIAAFNKHNDTRPRAVDGSTVVRFEMPFKIWCSGCYPESIIDQGSRFNATKKPTGKFFTTPIYEFKLKHADCGKTIVITTDPLNQTYKIVSGGRRQDHDFKSMDEGGDVGEALDYSNSKDPFAAQEAARYAARKDVTETSDIEELQKRSERQWENPYRINSQLRKYNRESKGGRWERDRVRQEGEAIANRSGLPFEIPGATTADGEQARKITFGQTAAQVLADEERFANSRSVFDKTSFKSSKRPAGISDQAWKAMMPSQSLKEASKRQIAGMEESFRGWDTVGVKGRKRDPNRFRSKLMGRTVTRRKIGTGVVVMKPSDTSSKLTRQPCKDMYTIFVVK